MSRARPIRLFDAEGREVFITQVCTKCRRSAPLAKFGLRKMSDGKIRSISQCPKCRGEASKAPPRRGTRPGFRRAS